MTESRRRLILLGAACFPLLTAALLGGCGGGDGAADLGSPSGPKKLSVARFVPTTFETAAQSLDRAFASHPDVARIRPLGGTVSASRELLAASLEQCRTGDPERYAASKIGACSILMGVAYDIYRQTGYEEFYQAAVDWANYFLTDLPDSQGKLDERLQRLIQDRSPSLD